MNIQFRTLAKFHIRIYLYNYITSVSESGGVNFGPRKIRGNSFPNLAGINYGEALRELNGLDMDSINGRTARSRRSTDDFAILGPVACFVAFMIASVFVIRVRASEKSIKTKKSIKNKSRKLARDNRADTTLL